MNVRVALVGGADAGALADGLRGEGLEAREVQPRGLRLVDGLLRRRGFTGPLTPVPLAVAALAAGRYDVAHAFSPPAALAALLWRERFGGRVAFTCTETLDRGNVADRRLRLRLLDRALREPDAVLAGGEDQRAALWRWMALEAPVLEPADIAGHARLYRELAARA